MRDFLRKIEKNKYFLTFVLLFAYAQSIQTRIRIRGEINVLSSVTGAKRDHSSGNVFE